MKPYDVIPGVTRSRWQALASQQKPAPDSVAFIHEASERGDELLKRYFGITEYRLDGKLMPAEHCLMPKAAGYEALEVADFIIQAAGNEALRRARGGRVPRRDAEAVFHVDQTLVSFFAIDSAELNNQSSAKTS